MKYLLLIYGNEELWGSFSKEEFDAVIREHDAFRRSVTESGEFVGAYGLADATLARAVRVREGVPAVTDGPYLEAKEHLASFYIVDCESDARATELVP